MRKLRTRWRYLFTLEPSGYMEVLLIIILLMAFRHGLFGFLRSTEEFYSCAAFGAATLEVQPVAWAAAFPPSWVLSPTFDKWISALVCLGSLCWIFKRFLPFSAILTTLLYGVWISLQESRNFNYHHEFQPGVAVMVVFAAFYTFRRKEISQAIRNRDFWQKNIYPRWVFVLIVLYLGVFYTNSAIVKLSMAGWNAGNGLTLQLTVGKKESTDLLSKLIVENRWIATIAMSSAVILELGAIVMFWIPKVRSFWAAGLIGMHWSILVSMRIPFLFNMVILLWMMIPGDRWIPRIRAWAAPRKGIQSMVQNIWISRLFYPFDFLGLIPAKSSASANPVEKPTP